MLIKEISYSILESIREGQVVDDERISLRLINSLIPIKRATYLRDIIKTGQSIPKNAIQYIDLTVDLVEENSINHFESSISIPKPIDSRYGSGIKEISSLDLDQYAFSFVNNNHYRMSGNGKFNGGTIFVTYYKNNLFFKSKSSSVKSLENCILAGVFEDPTDVPGFDEDTDDYPIDIQGIDEIKKAIYRLDIDMIMRGMADEINDSSGEIKS